MGATEANTTLQARPETTSENIEALLDVRKEKKINELKLKQSYVAIHITCCQLLNLKSKTNK